MKRSLVVLLAVLAMLVSACGASGDSTKGEDDDENPQSTTPVESSEGAFGDLTELCGPGEYTVKADEAGKGTDKLYIAVPNDRSSTYQAGLNKVLWDASTAFSSWCNEQGGIGGLQIELVDADAGVFQVENAMTTACNDSFMMVGGGLVTDNLEFSGKDGSDFHKCGMAEIPAFTVSPAKSDSNGMVSPLPNPSTSFETGYFSAFRDIYPEETKAWGVINADIDSLDPQTQKYIAAAEDLGINFTGKVPYPVIGVSDFTPYVRKFLDMKAGSFTFVGEVEGLNSVVSGLRMQKWDGVPLLEANVYDPKFAAEPAAEGSVVRMTYHPLEEADLWPATKKYIEINEKYVPGGELGGLGIQSTSAWLLFVTAANACAADNGGELSRDCILKEADAVDEWSGGGLHGRQDPKPGNTAKAGACTMLLVVKDGSFERLFPELDSDDDDFQGFSCPTDSIIEVTANKGKGVVDPDRPI